MASSPELLEARSAVVDAARRLVAGEVGVIVSARAITRAAHTLDPHMQDAELLGFIAIDSQSDHLTVGPLLEQWHPSVREARRQEMLEFEASYGPEALRD